MPSKLAAFSRHVVRLENRLSVVERQYFSVRPVHHVFSGFCLDYGRFGCRVWRFSHPLFSRAKTLTLLYAQELSPLRVPMQRSDSAKVLATAFIENIEPHLPIAERFLSLQNWREELENSQTIRNPHARLELACARLLLNDNHGVLEQLDILVEIARGEDQRGWPEPSWAGDVFTLRELLQTSPSRARALVEGWEEEGRQRFNVNSQHGQT